MKIKHLSRVVTNDPFGKGKKWWKSMRRKVGLTGKQVKSRLFAGSSARDYAAYSSGDSVYGPTGSIVGRY